MEHYVVYFQIVFIVFKGLYAIVLLALRVKRIKESFVFRTLPKQKTGPIKVKPTLDQSME